MLPKSKEVEACRGLYVVVVAELLGDADQVAFQLLMGCTVAYVCVCEAPLSSCFDVLTGDADGLADAHDVSSPVLAPELDASSPYNREASQ